MTIVKRTLPPDGHNLSVCGSSKYKKRKIPSSVLSYEKFIRCLKGLTPEQKVIVRNLGFQSLLDLSCANISLSLVMWLVQHFDTNTRCINLDNGFFFQLDAFAVHQVLGIPMGHQKIVLSQHNDSLEVIRNDIKFKGSLPTLKEIKNAMTPQLSGDSFRRIFLLYVLSRFLCPTGHHRASSILFEPVVQGSKPVDMDFCSLTVDWLVECLIVFKRNLDRGIECKVGGCMFVLVVSYFEFLITSEFTLGAKTPRISLWTTNIVQSYTALDSLDASDGIFGRLPLKHVSCTPFSKVERLKNHLPINSLPEIADTCLTTAVPFHLQDKVARMYISEAYSKLCETAIASVAPVINLIASDVANSLRCKHLNTTAPPQGNVSVIDNDCDDSECEGSSCESDDCFEVSNKLYLRQLREQQMDELSSSFKKLEVPDLKDTSDHFRDMTQILIDSMSQIPIDMEFNLPKGSLSVEAIQQSVFREACSHCYFPSPPQPDAGVDLIQLASLGTQPAPPHGYSEKDKKMTYVPPTAMRPIYGLSLAERLLGRRISPCWDPHTDIPSFDAITDSITNEQAHVGDLGTDGTNNYDAEESFWQQAAEMTDRAIQSKTVHSSYTHGTSFLQSSIRENLPPDAQQVVFSTTEEKDMFSLLTSNVTKENKKRYSLIFFFAQIVSFIIIRDIVCRYNLSFLLYSCSERIFKIDKIWLDKTIFCFSMRTNGWMHVHVMDAFCKMLIVDQVERSRLGKLRKNEISKYFFHSEVVGLLTDPELFHNDIKASFSEYGIGYRLENAGLVFLPCCVNSQWFAVVANFIDCRFDILNPQKVTSEEIKKVISTIVHNFKGCFMVAYPRCARFNIRSFDIRYVDVPKQKYREDSGVMLVRMFQCFDGIEVQKFSNVSATKFFALQNFQVDIQSIREVLLFQLVTFPYNEERPIIAKKYVDAYFAALVEETMRSMPGSGAEQKGNTI
ncbi:hypothetical protein EJB05_05973, partial [Eragrostis curvula]